MKILRNGERESGFTVVEIVITIAVLVILTAFFVIQRNSLNASFADSMRKLSVDAFYINLKNVYYKKNHYYPRTISRETLPGVTPSFFTDPDNFTLAGDKCVNNSTGQDVDAAACDYHYSASKCDGDGHCAAFKISADMQTEATYTKTSDSSD